MGGCLCSKQCNSESQWSHTRCSVLETNATILITRCKLRIRIQWLYALVGPILKYSGKILCQMLLGNNAQSLYNMYMICVCVKLIFNMLNPLQRESKSHFASLCQYVCDVHSRRQGTSSVQASLEPTGIWT